MGLLIPFHCRYWRGFYLFSSYLRGPMSSLHLFLVFFFFFSFLLSRQGVRRDWGGFGFFSDSFCLSSFLFISFLWVFTPGRGYDLKPLRLCAWCFQNETPTPSRGNPRAFIVASSFLFTLFSYLVLLVMFIKVRRVGFDLSVVVA